MASRADRRERIAAALYAQYMSQPQDVGKEQAASIARQAAATAVDLANYLLDELDAAEERYGKRPRDDKGISV